MALKGGGFQFGHIDWFSKTGSTKKYSHTGHHGSQRSRGWSTADILAEVLRKNGHCQHVEHPKPPTILVGSVEGLTSAIDEWRQSQKVKVKLKNGTERERALRSDAPEMAAGVISFPKDRIDEWPVFRDHAIEKLKEKHGERLRLVVEHQDERHPHFHYYLTAKPGEDFGVVHDGYAASRQARKEPDNKIRTAFNTAMSAWQDWVHKTISEPFGLARLSPNPRGRWSRAKWNEEEREKLEAEASRISKETEKLEKLAADIERRDGLLAQKREKIDQKELNNAVALAGKAQKIQEAENAVKQKTAEMDKLQREMQRLITENEKTRADMQAMFKQLSPLHQGLVQMQIPKIVDVLKKTENGEKPNPLGSLGL